jgi:hypothetical protein
MLSSSCPYGAKEPHKYCRVPDTDISESAYYYSLFLEPAKIIYMLIILENVMYLAYYKDIIFGLCCVIEFIGIYHNAMTLNTGGGSKGKIDSSQINSWILSMLIICSVLEVFTFVFSFRSAFYIKA